MIQNNWFSSCYRKFFLDYHTQKNVTETGSAFNADEWAALLDEAGVQAVSCFAKCAFGWRYYRKGNIGYIHPHLPDGVDFLQDTIRACHERNIRVIAYYHTFGSEAITEYKPEWCIRNAQGESQNHSICMLGPAFEAEMLPQIAEIVSNYDVDAIFLDGTYYNGNICYCDSCRERFLLETGLRLPLDKNDVLYKKYSEWAIETYKKMRAIIYDTVAKHNPNALVAINWVYSARQVQIPPEETGFLSIDIDPSNMLFTSSYQARNWALNGIPFDIMNHMSLKWWSDFGIKPLNSLLQESALTLINGGRTWVGYQMYPQYGVEPYLFKILKKNFDFVRTLEPQLIGSDVMPYVGVLHTEAQVETRINTSDGNANADEESLQGLHKMMVFSGIHYNSCTSNVFLDRLDQFKAVIVAGDQYIEPEIVQALDSYVNRGGALLLTGKSGMISKKGEFVKNPTLEKLAGVSIDESYPYEYGYIKLRKNSGIENGAADMPLLLRKKIMAAKPVTASVLADTLTMYRRSDDLQLHGGSASDSGFSPPGELFGTSAISINHYGNGRVVYVAGDIFAAYNGSSVWSLKNIAKNIINKLLIDKPIVIDAPDYVELAFALRKNQLIVHMVNLVREWPMTSFNVMKEYIIGEDIIPIHDIKLHIPVKGLPAKVTLGVEERSAEFNYSNGSVHVDIPVLDIYECVIIHDYNI